MDILRAALQEIRDTQRHIDREKLYGERGHFPIPQPSATSRNYLLAQKRVVRSSNSQVFEQSARNQQNLNNLQAIANLFEQDLLKKAQVS